MSDMNLATELETNNEAVMENGGYISKLVLNNGKEIDVKENDIIVFVGPNNTGKSQSLKDIYELCERKKPTIVVKDIEIVKKQGSLAEFLDKISSVNDTGLYKEYKGLGYKIVSTIFNGYNTNQYYGDARNVFVTYLDTLNRLKISDSAPMIERKASKTHPIHYAAFDRKYREWLGSNFKKAFGKEVIPHIQNGSKIPLCIGDLIKLDKEFDNEQDRMEAYIDILDTYKQVQNQGDGIKSFTGILLYLMLDHYCTFLIDEPESFLHPPQANIMGRIIGQTLRKTQQAFISTHSEEFIKGLLDVCPERVKIVRITREEDKNEFSILENTKFNEIWNDPLLKYSNIMTSLFHKEVILCESDSDCKMYSIIENQLKHNLGKYSETLFIHCGGKHRMARIANALKSLNIEVKLIPDIDVLNDEKVFKEIVEAFGIEWNYICSDYKVIVSNLHSKKESINRSHFKNAIELILGKSTKQELSNDEIKEIRLELQLESKWEVLKKGGVAVLPSGDATTAFDKINEKLKNAGIFIVTVGELECFIKKVGGHGPEWVNKVLEMYPDLEDEVYKGIKDFVEDICK